MSAPAPRRPRGGRPALREGSGALLDAAVLALLLATGLLGFGPTFGSDPRYLLAGAGGILLGLGVAALAARRRFGAAATAGTAAAAYLLFGSALAAPREALFGVLPSLVSLRLLLAGIVTSWKDLLTVAAPVGVSGGMLVVPFLASLLCALAAGTLAWRARHPSWAALPVLALFVAGIAFGTSEAFWAVPRGALTAAGLVAWLAYRRETGRRQPALAGASGPRPDRAHTLRRLGFGAGILVVSAVAAMAAGPALSAGDDRRVLRDTIDPPFDIQDYPSPLMSFRQYVKDRKDDVLFTVSGLPKDGRVRLAAMDAYDGTVYNVSDNSGSGSFAPVGDARALAGGADSGSGQSYQLKVSIQGYQGVWLPGAHIARGFGFADAEDSAAKGLFFNSGSDTALSVNGVSAPENYTVNVEEPARYKDSQLAQYDFASVSLPKPDNVPQVVDTKAADLVANAGTPIDRVRALERYLQKFGKFSNGLVEQGQVRSLSGHTAARIKALLTGKEMVGDDEQYAVAMALMARELGIPARVVMGFYPDPKDPANGAPTVQIKGKDVHAWVEVDFDKAGWVAFNPTPDKDNVPTPPDPEPRSTPKPQVLQPPPPAQEPAQLPPDSAPDALDADKQRQDPWLFWGPILAAIGIALVPVAVVALPLLLILFLKLRRRRRRYAEGHPAQRLGGGWKELFSLATDMGAGLDPKGTRRETAAAIGTAFPPSRQSATALAHRADASIFGADHPTEEEIAAYWNDVDSSLAELRNSVGWWQRQRARFSPRSLLLDARSRLARRGASPLAKPAGYLRRVESSARRTGTPKAAGTRENRMDRPSAD